MDILRDADIDPAPLAGARIAVIGFGNQGRAQALNLRDGSWQPLWYNAPLSAATGETRSLSYYVGYGKDEDADVTVRTSDTTPYVVIARFTGDLPY